MYFPRARAGLVLLVLLALLAAACSSGSDTADADPTRDDQALGAAEPAAAEVPSDDSTDGGASTVSDSGEDDVIAAEDGDEPIDREAATVGLVRALFNLDPAPEAVECILAEADTRPNLAQAIDEQMLVFMQYSDDMLVDVTHGLNGCVDPLGLGGWATEAVSPAGDVRDTAPACFADAFEDPDQGDGLFHMFVALSFQFRYDPAFAPRITEVFTECTPVTSLADYFANQSEAESGYRTVVDRDCFLDAIDSPDVSNEFWGALIDGLVSPVTVLTPYLNDCTTVADSDLLAAVPDDFVPWSGTGALAVVAPSARAFVYTTPPPMTIDPDAEYEAVLATGGGEIRIRLFADTAPVTVNNFVNLARDGFYDRTVFHRVLDDFMAQAGDPTGTGTGGPGYQFDDEVEGGPPLDRAGLLAMANSGPNTNGSQFFITFVPTDWLTGNHTVFGEVIEGQDLVDAIERRNPDAPTSRGQVLDSVTIIER